MISEFLSIESHHVRVQTQIDSSRVLRDSLAASLHAKPSEIPATRFRYKLVKQDTSIMFLDLLLRKDGGSALLFKQSHKILMVVHTAVCSFDTFNSASVSKSSSITLTDHLLLHG